jgi:hypothetical protein
MATTTTPEVVQEPQPYAVSGIGAGKTTERILTVVMIWAAAAATTYLFWWIDGSLADASRFSAVFAYWGLFYTFFFGLYLGLGGGDCYSCTLETEVFSPAAIRKAVGTAIALAGTAISVALTVKFAEFGGADGAMGLNFASAQVFSLLPLHWGFVWLVFVQHLGLV